MFEAVIAGIISGVIVSIASWFFHHYRKPKIELKYGAGGTLTLVYHRLTPIVIGGSWALEIGRDIFVTPSGRAATYGIVVKPFEQQVLLSMREYIAGEAIAVSYKRLPFFPLRWSKKMTVAYEMQKEADLMLDYLDHEKSPDGWRATVVQITT